MVRVSGRLLDFVEDPSNVAQVQVRAQEVRPHGDGVMLDHPVTVEWDPESGVVSFDAPASAMGVIMWHAVGRSNASGSLPIIVPDADSASLADCVRNAEMADGRDASELAGILEQIRESVGGAAEARAGAEAAAVDAAGSAVSAGRDAARAETAAVDAAGSAVSAGRDAARAEAAAGKLDASTFLTGTGFPEGRVSAPVGAVYTDTAATNGAIRWLKASGTGATGWAVDAGDTGWRNITTVNSNIVGTVGEGGAVTIRRFGDVVTFRLLGPIFADDRGRFEVRDITTRFTPAMRLYLPMATQDGEFKPQITQYHFQISGQPAGQTIVRAQGNVEFTWTTTAAWPTYLPGTPV